MELFVQGLRSPSYQQDKKHGVRDYLVGEEHQCCVRLGHSGRQFTHMGGQPQCV